MASRTIRVCDRSGKEVPDGEMTYEISGFQIKDRNGDVIIEFGGWAEVSEETMQFCLARFEQVALKPRRGRKKSADGSPEVSEDSDPDDDEEEVD